jgi:hypothetical protein
MTAYCQQTLNIYIYTSVTVTLETRACMQCSADRNGSRFVQQALEAAAPEEIAMVYKEIMPCVRTLAVDMFGNHAIQKVNIY